VVVTWPLEMAKTREEAIGMRRFWLLSKVGAIG
jgi:hypothetical protein